MKKLILAVSMFIFTATGCENIESYLPQAKTYTIVGDAPITMNNEKRTGKIFFITSPARAYDEFAQTALLAAWELHKANDKLDVIQVELIPGANLIFKGLSYATVYYAADKKGMEDFSGSDPNAILKFTWLVRAASQPLNDADLTMVNLWFDHMKDFPSKNLYSNLLYDNDDLVKFVAGTMHIPVSEVKIPMINLKEYKNLPFIK